MIKKAVKPARSWALIILLSAILCIAISPHSVSATKYGEGKYGACQYENCPQPTITTTPTGLEVSINLTNGQKIPLGGYTILITPLNGKGASFKKADIYVNGTLVHSSQPDETGTVKWLWVPESAGDTKVKIVITDTNDDTTTKNFDVTVTETPVQSQGQNQNQNQTKSSSPKKSGLAAVAQSIANGVNSVVNAATNAIKSLPKPIVRSFPYLLFLLLLIDAILLFFQTQRELHGYRLQLIRTARMRQVDEARRTFLELASHYFRTPLTIMLGGIELLDSRHELVASSAINLKAAAEDMRTKIESLLAQLNQLDQPVSVNSSQTITKTRAWLQPALFLPIGLIALLWIVFSYLVRRAGTFSVGQIELLMQLLCFTAVGIALYVLIRHRRLRRKDAAQLKIVEEHEQSLAKSRDELISGAITVLQDDLTQIDTIVARLNAASPAVKPIKGGLMQLQILVDKLTIAGRLTGGHSTKPFSPVRLLELVNHSADSLHEQITAKSISISIPENVVFQSSEPELLTLVLKSLLDNSIAYSPEHASIEIRAERHDSAISIHITDHGSGIPADKLALVMQPFSKAEGAEVFSHEGMGFSLYLDKLIMTYLGGSIDINSQPGNGTQVTLHLPVNENLIINTDPAKLADLLQVPIPNSNLWR